MTEGTGEAGRADAGGADVAAKAGRAGAGRGGGEEHWYEDESGSIVRPYTVTRGRTRPAVERHVDLMARVSAVEPGTAAGDDTAAVRHALDHARSWLLDLIGRRPRPLAELAADADLPLTVVRVLLGDLVDAGLVRVDLPAALVGGPGPELLREVAARLREL